MIVPLAEVSVGQAAPPSNKTRSDVTVATTDEAPPLQPAAREPATPVLQAQALLSESVTAVKKKAVPKKAPAKKKKVLQEEPADPSVAPSG